MLASLLLLSALSAWSAPPEESTVLIDARLPADVVLDGVRLAQLFTAGRLEVTTTPGTHQVAITTNGLQRTLDVSIEPGATSHILVGRNGLSTDVVASEVVDADITPVEFRATGDEGLLVRIGSQKLSVSPGDAIRVEIAPGDHQVSLRNLAGTVIWARGTLHVSGPELVVVQLTEGRAPEVSGVASFSPASGG